MTGHGAAPAGFATRALQAGALVVLFGVGITASRLAPARPDATAALAAVGFLLLAGTLLSELLETIGLPHLTGYLLAGIVAGPHVLHVVDHVTVERLAPVNTLALALIAFAGGAELRVESIREVARGLAWATLVQTAGVLVALAAGFAALARFVPFTAGMSSSALLGVGLLWGVIAVSRSPSALLGILAQTRAKGPLARFSLAFVMSSDVVVVLLLAVVLMVARPLIQPGAALSTEDFAVLGHEILGSVSLGTTLGLVLAAYLRLVGKNLMLVLLALGFGMTEALRYVHFEPLLTFLTAGFVVQNLSGQGEKLLHGVERTSGVVFVVFFATAGAHLDLPLLRSLWPVALSLASLRVVATWGAARVASRLASDEPVVRRWGWSSLVSQAGLSLGVAMLIARTFPEFGQGFAALAVATVAINELVGPVLFKVALDRAGETSTAPEVSRPHASFDTA
ncbi:MAG: sodium:proton exchanger [Polyangiaceae bacterium]|nr:sodium:proton exchanger [Polyangiaceae bacterium]